MGVFAGFTGGFRKIYWLWDLWVFTTEVGVLVLKLDFKVVYFARSSCGFPLFDGAFPGL